MKIIGAAIAIAIGLLVLAGYFVPALSGMQAVLLNWAMILAGVAALIGVFNLVSVHGNKIRAGGKGGVYSALLLLSLFATFVFALFLKPGHAAIQVLFNGVILPVEASLMAIISVSLLFAAIHMLRRSAGVMNITFLITALVVLIGSLSLPFGQIPLLGDTLRPWITQVLSMGGARGILIGVALGSLTTGLRVLLALDRPYGGK
ncbi:MAG TPA: hypothetical protein VIV15_15060 [Anaerolineales bacterium]